MSEVVSDIWLERAKAELRSRLGREPTTIEINWRRQSDWRAFVGALVASGDIDKAREAVDRTYSYALRTSLASIDTIAFGPDTMPRASRATFRVE